MELGTIAATLAGEMARKVAEHEIVSRVTKQIISRWSDHRATKFMEAFIEEVRKEKDVRHESANLNDYLDSIKDDEAPSSALFDAYRRVCLSASKSTGPQIIGLLTAHLIVEKREANDEEELIFQAAEQLNDADLVAVTRFRDEQIRGDLAERLRGGRELSGNSRVLVASVSNDMQFGRVGLNPPPVSVGTELGIWSLKLLNLGLIWQEVEREVSDFDTLNTVDGDPPRTSNLYVFISPGFQRLAQLIDRARTVSQTSQV